MCRGKIFDCTINSAKWWILDTSRWTRHQSSKIHASEISIEYSWVKSYKRIWYTYRRRPKRANKLLKTLSTLDIDTLIPPMCMKTKNQSETQYERKLLKVWSNARIFSSQLRFGCVATNTFGHLNIQFFGFILDLEHFPWTGPSCESISKIARQFEYRLYRFVFDAFSTCFSTYQ